MKKNYVTLLLDVQILSQDVICASLGEYDWKDGNDFGGNDIY